MRGGVTARPSPVLAAWLVIWLAFGTVPSGFPRTSEGGGGCAFAASIERVVVLPPAPDAVSPATAQLLGEFFRQEVEQDVRFQLVSIDSRPCGDAACAARVGRELGADRVLWSRVLEASSGLRLLAEVTHVQTGRSLDSVEVSAKGEQELFVAAGTAVERLLDGLASPPPETATETAPPGSSLPVVVHAPVERAPVGVALDIEAEVRGGLGKRELYAMFQVGGSSRVRYTQLRPSGERDGATVYLSSIPSSALTSAGLRYYLRLTTSGGNEVARFPSSGWWSVETIGDPNAPATHGPRQEGVIADQTPDPGARPSADEAAERAATDRAATDRAGETAPGPTGAELARSDAGSTGGKNKKWFLIGGAAVALGGLVALLAGGGGDSSDPPGDEPTTLPLPPEHE